MKLKEIMLAGVCLFGATLLFAQNEGDFYTARTGGMTKNLRTDYSVDNNFNTDDSQKLQRAINDVSNAGGGRIIIPGGSYTFTNVTMKSNVRIEINKNATIRPKPNAPGNPTIFALGGNFLTVKNVSIIGTGGGRFTVDVRNVTNKNIVVFSCTNVNNFQLANFNVLDDYTVFQSINFSPKKVGSRWFTPTKGLVKNAKAANCHYGYGLVQVQAAEQILFKNIDGKGGVTLRLESGWDVMNAIPEPNTPKIKNVFGRTIKCSFGQAALMMEPHSIRQGRVDVRDITTIGCEFGATIGKGSNHKNTSLTPGTFASNSVVANVKATYRENATVRSHYLPFIPCNLRSKIRGNTPSGEAKFAPSVAVVGYFSNGLRWGRGPSSPGSYKVNLSDVKAFGFQSGLPNVVTSDYCDFESCPIQVWIHPSARNTIGNCVPPNTSGGGSNPPSGGSGNTFHLRKRNKRDFAIDGGGGGENGRNVKLWASNTSNVNQKWVQINRGGGFFSFKKANTDFCLDGGSGGANGQSVKLWRCNATNQNQQWKKVNVGGGAFRLQKRNASGFSIDGGAGGINGQNLRLQRSNNNNWNQHWLFSTVSNKNIISNRGNIGGVLYPNPARDLLNVELGEETTSDTKVTVVNSHGVIVIEKSLQSNEASLDLNVENLTSGVYFVQIITEGTTLVKKFIKE